MIINKKYRVATIFATFAIIFIFLVANAVNADAVNDEPQDDFNDDGIVETIQEDDNGEEMTYESPIYDGKQFHFVDHFDNVEESRKRWIKSQAKKDDTADEIAKYDGIWAWESPQRIVWKNDIGLVLKSKAKHAAIASKLDKVFTFKDEKPLVVQYEVTLQSGQDCGGSYIKLLSAGKQTEDLTKFNDKTPYTIMFGPDKCGNDIKMHFIFRHVNPINGSVTEKHCKKPKDRLEDPFKDKLPHLYQLVINPDNSFSIAVDHNIINEGTLLSAFTPPVNPPVEIDDPEDKKPVDWDEREKIPDPTSKKPEDWNDDAPPKIPDPNAVKPDGWLDDEPEMIPDPNAHKPEDWDTEIDGEWEAPLVDNPVCENAPGCGKYTSPLIDNKEYKGKWRAPLIDNPNYQGKWAPRKIPNPDYFEDLTPFKMTPISAVGIELWSMSSDILFDNLIITDDLEVAKDFAEKSFNIKRKYIDKESDTFMNKIVTYANDNPWSWKILVVVIVAPLAFSLYRLFSKGSSKDSSDESAKKTDAIQEDDVVPPAAEEIDEEIKSNSTATLKSNLKQKKSDLDVKEDELLPTSSSSSNEDISASNPIAVQDDEAENEEETEDLIAKSTGARKRRVRKDES